MSIFEELKHGVVCETAEATIALGRQIAASIPSNQVIALKGDLGAGKTTLTKGIGNFLEIPESSITSPTFSLYSIHQGVLQLIHIDGYRLENGNECDDLLIEEFVKDPWLIVVEWPERGLADWMLPLTWTFELNRDSSTSGLSIKLLETPEIRG